MRGSSSPVATPEVSSTGEMRLRARLLQLKCSRFRVQGSMFKVQGSGFKVWQHNTKYLTIICNNNWFRNQETIALLDILQSNPFRLFGQHVFLLNIVLHNN